MQWIRQSYNKLPNHMKKLEKKQSLKRELRFFLLQHYTHSVREYTSCKLHIRKFANAQHATTIYNYIYISLASTLLMQMFWYGNLQLCICDCQLWLKFMCYSCVTRMDENKLNYTQQDMHYYDHFAHVKLVTAALYKFT